MKKCVVFRKKNLKDMGEVGLVAFMGGVGKKLMLEKLHLISKQHSCSPIGLLCDKNNVIFDKLIIRKKKNLLPY